MVLNGFFHVSFQSIFGGLVRIIYLFPCNTSFVALKVKRKVTSRPYLPPRLRHEHNTWAQMDVRGSNENLQKMFQFFWRAYSTILFPQRLAIVWGSYSCLYYLQENKESSPINVTQMSMYPWYSHGYELKSHISKLESMKMFSLSMIICKTFSPYMMMIDPKRVNPESVSSEEAL